MSEGPATAPCAPATRKAALREVGLFFLRLGFTAFGGPAGHIAMMEHEAVRLRGWLCREEFLDLLGAMSLIPGPSSTEMAIVLGYRRAGWPGLLLAGIGFILPAAGITAALAWAYVRYGALPQAAGLLYGVKPVLIAIVAQALLGLGRSALKSWPLGLIGAVAAVANALGGSPLPILAGAGGTAMAARWIGDRARGACAPREQGMAVLPLVPGALAPMAGAAPFGLWPLFLFFLKVGTVLFGSGYVLLAFLRADLVIRWHWLTEAQLLDAVAIGQVTPGPVFTTATFIGYLLGRGWGALLATLGIFLPSFGLVALSGPLVPRLRRSPTAGAFLDGANVASLALMVVVTVQLARSALVDAITAALAALSAVLLLRFHIRSSWLVLGGALLGLGLAWLR